jgi:serine/threonine protein kinase
MSFPISQLKLLLILLHTLTIIICCVSTTEFVYNTNFNSTNIILYGNVTINKSILTLLNDTSTSFSIARAFYPHKVPTKPPNSSTLLPFATSFIFSVSPIKHFIPGHGFAFIFTPSRHLNGTTPAEYSTEYIGLFNFKNDNKSNNHVLAVEFDIVKNEQFNDTNDNHVGIDVNSLTSLTSHEAGYWSGKHDNEFKVLKIKSGENYQVWIEFNHSHINVTMARAGRKRPHVPLISMNLNLSGVLMDETYVGFSAANGLKKDSVKILAWSYSNKNFSIGDALVTHNLPSFVPHKGWFSGEKAIAVEITGVVCVLIIGCAALFILYRGNREEEIEDWEIEYWPHRISFQEIHAATGGFSEENVVFVGGNKSVHKGMLQGVEVAVKRIPHQREGMREFLAEVSSLGRLKHRNLVGFRGWCKEDKENLILVYDFMNNGSLDKWIFECEEGKMLTWEERIKVLKNVAVGILYMHEDWEVKVLHRDIKASNVLLDKDMNARLGDFGLALMHEHHGEVASTTKVLGTLGYIAPEVIQIGRASTMSDVFGFGILVLEVICGRRPIEEHKPGIIEWVESLMVLDQLHNAVDERLKDKGGYPIEEAERLLHLGLLCSNFDPSVRPIMRQVVKMLEGETDNIESDEENIETSLLRRIQSAAMWPRTESGLQHRDHPTLEDIRLFSYKSKTSTSGSSTIPQAPQSDSDIIEEGR